MKLQAQTTVRPSTSNVPRLAAALAAVLVAPIALVATLSAPAMADASAVASTTFGFTGGVQAWTAPAGMNRATVTLYGAAGESGGAFFGSHQPGGKGAEVTAVIAVTPGANYDVYVGGAGDRGVGGFNGGGSASGCCGIVKGSGVGAAPPTFDPPAALSTSG